jgi:hypothetical protein
MFEGNVRAVLLVHAYWSTAHLRHETRWNLAESDDPQLFLL